MKKYITLAFIAVSILTVGKVFSINRYEDEMPTKIQIFLDKHFKIYQIDKFKYDRDDNECKVKYKNGIKVEFKNGDWQEIESNYMPLPKSIIDILPLPAIDFIAKRYSQRPIIKIEHKSDGYKVKLDGSVTIKFDQMGNIVKVSN